MGLLSKKTTSQVQHACLYICTTMTWKCLISRFMEDVNKRRRIFLSLSKLECGPQEINSREICLHLAFSADWNKRDNVWKNANAFSKGRLRCRRHRSSLLGTFRSDDGDGNEDVKKAICLISKTTILHVHHHCTTTTWKSLISRFTK